MKNEESNILEKDSLKLVYERELQLDKNLKVIKSKLQAEKKKEQELHQELKKLEAKLQEKQKKYEQVERERNRFKKGFQTIENSRIWKSLEPARKAGRLFKKGKHQESAADKEKKNVSAPQEKKPVAQKDTPTKSESNNAVSKEKQQSVKQQPAAKKAWQKRADHKILRAKKRMLNLGFTEKGYSELKHMAMDVSKPYLQKKAAWELAVWHANQYTEKDAKESLALLTIIFALEKDPLQLQRAQIIQIECLQLTGEHETAKEIALKELQENQTADLYLAAANLENSMDKRMEWINKALQTKGISEIKLDLSLHEREYDCLTHEAIPSHTTQSLQENPKVTVIMPVYNAEDVIATAINSVLSQTWRNLEVLVADDCSTDRTAEIVSEFEKKDERVKLIKAEVNGGAYAARNLAFQAATGDYVTCNDADDWSHPQKIETQVLHLLQNPDVMANSSQQARATEDLKFYRRGNPGFYTFNNMSSLMFRHKVVKAAIGYWDSVRFAADSEFVKRLKRVFGEDACVELQTGPLTFQRQSGDSLTANSAFGYHGFFMGVRKEYFEAQMYHHQNTSDYYYDFPQTNRPFQVPEPMWPKRDEKTEGRRHFDVIIVSDFRLDGGSNISNMEEINAQKVLGLRTGLIQMSRYDYDPKKKINPQVREMLDGDQVQMLFYGEKVSCDLLIVRYPPVLQDRQTYIPDVEAENIRVIVNQTPYSDYSETGKLRYNIPKCNQYLEELFGKPGVWCPIGPLVRETLLTRHPEDLKTIELAEEDWSNIINVAKWKRDSVQKRGDKIRIGRHSRGDATKWPPHKEELLAIYPDSPEYEIHVLGGAEAPAKVLGGLPDNWKVIEFGQMPPQEFLKEIDVFVYYTHPDLVESFGRVILEAMAVGIPAILPPHYKGLFGEAAIYAEPAQVKEKIDQLMQDEAFYRERVEKAHEYAEFHFGYTRHEKRLNPFLSNREVTI